MRKIILTVVLAALSLGVSAAEWQMFNRRLGMFVHWGIYSVGEWHEQEHWRRSMSRADYEKYVSRFTAEKFNADDFVDVAKSAGAEYIVFTSKHHDGFCMWDTKTTDYNVMNTPAKRDIARELAEACHRRGLGFGFYFSNPDWHAKFANNAKSTHQIPMEPGDEPDFERYVAYVKAQVTELCTNYGKLCCFFWDIPTRVDRPEMDELVRRLQPGIMIDDRGWGNKATCDYSTPERDYKWDAPTTRKTEACDALGVHSWGYRREEDYHTIGYLTRKIDQFLATGANFLLNVGPKSDGTIPDVQRAMMVDVGAWLRKTRESLRGVETVPNVIDAKQGAIVTRRGSTMYVHFPKGLDASGVDLFPYDLLPKRATVLNTGTELSARVELMPWRSNRKNAKPSLHLWGIPADQLANECIVIRIEE